MRSPRPDDAPEALLPVFAYGLLQPGQPGFVELSLHSKVDILGRDQVRGTLYDLGDYPAAVLNGRGTIAGTLLKPRSVAVLAMMDSYELFYPDDPTGSEYRRVRAQTLDRHLDVWLFVYNHDVTSAPVIAGGAWRPH